MDKFEHLVKDYMSTPCTNCKKYSPIGKTFYANKEFYKGYYWYYEGKDFIVDIHDFFIKKDYIGTILPNMRPYIFLISNYLISGSGEWLNPYQVIEPGSMFIMDIIKPPQRYILHANCRFFIIGMKFKENMIEECLIKKTHVEKCDVSKIFMETQNDITASISKLADEILNCKMDGISAELFFEAKAREWLSITIDAYENLKEENTLTETDKNSVESVAKYIENHYAFDISQDFLEKIASMSGTKLKETFKQRYKMNITEFTQRKRMNIAENLLLTTDLDVRAIAKSVGYTSPSRFSTLFKRYKGIYPKDVKKYTKGVTNCMCEYRTDMIDKKL